MDRALSISAVGHVGSELPRVNMPPTPSRKKGIFLLAAYE